jgi:hypothetical protein
MKVARRVLREAFSVYETLPNPPLFKVSKNIELTFIDSLKLT